MHRTPSRAPATTVHTAKDDVPATEPTRGSRRRVRLFLLSCVVGVRVLPGVAFSQTAFVYSEHKPPMAGTAIWVAEDTCGATTATFHVANGQLAALRRPLPNPDTLIEVARAYAQAAATQPSAGARAWQVDSPGSLEAGAYAIRLACESGAPEQVAAIDVQALLPLVTGAVTVRDSDVARGDRVRLTIRHLDDWRGLNEVNGAAEIRLFLDGAEFENVEPQRTDMSADTYDATLTVDVADANQLAAWARIVRRSDSAFTVDDVEVSVGVSSGRPFPSYATLQLRILPSYWRVGVGIFGALVILVVVWLAVRTPLLRDCNGEKTDAPFSLARHQIAFWTIVVVGAYVYIAMVTGGFGALNTTALALIGISGTTALVAATIDERRRGAIHRPLRHEGWFEDLLGDNKNGVCIHRLQIVIWTLVLGFFYVLEVCRNLVMPEFDVTQLGLLGISSGLYVGFKFPEPVP